MHRAIIVALGVALSFAACSKKDAAPADKAGAAADKGGATADKGGAAAVAHEAARAVGTDGIARVPVEANNDGYTPARIAGKPGEKLVLVFTRTANSDCISQLKAPDGKLVDLPLGTPVEVAVTVPQTGEVGFACGMDMFHGVVVATPSS